MYFYHRKINIYIGRFFLLKFLHQICHVCYKTKIVFNCKPSGHRVIDDFIRHTQVSVVREGGKMEFVPYNQFKDVKFIAEGGFSKIIKLLGLMAHSAITNLKSL